MREACCLMRSASAVFDRLIGGVESRCILVGGSGVVPDVSW